VLQAKVGSRVLAGDPLLRIHANTEAACAQASARLLAAYSWAESDVSPPPLVYKVIN